MALSAVFRGETESNEIIVITSVDMPR